MPSLSPATVHAVTTTSPPSPAPGISTTTVIPRQPYIPWLSRAIERDERVLLVLSVLPIIFAFNGRWRIGLDNSLYRGLARSIAQGRGYQFGDFASHHIYPGLPVLLAALTNVFGDNVFRPVAPLIMITLMAIAVLFVTFQLIARNYPRWIAIFVTVGLAINTWFVDLSQDLLTDVPFLLGLTTSLLGWDLLRTRHGAFNRAKSASLMIGGLLLAGSMRPTFWILALAMLIAWLCGFVRGIWKGDWRLYAVCLAVLASLFVLLWSVDPRTGKGFHPLSGGYETELLDVLWAGRPAIVAEIHTLLKEHLPAAFLGNSLPWGTSIPFSTWLVIGSVVVLVRRQPIWAMIIIITMAVTAVLSTEPRYYLMITPFLLLGFAIMVQRICSCLSGGWGDLALLLGLLVVVGMNVGRDVSFISQQHQVSLFDSGLRFYNTYRDGEFPPVIRLADLIRRKVGPNERVISPSPQVVAYLSERQVPMERELVPPRRNHRQIPEQLSKAQVTYAIFPRKFYREKQPIIARLMRRHVLVPGKRMGATDGMYLAKLIVQVPRGDWREGPAIPIRTTSKASTKPASGSTGARPPAKKTAAAKAAAKRRRKRLAATQSALRASNVQSSAARKKPTTGPSSTKP